MKRSLEPSFVHWSDGIQTEMRIVHLVALSFSDDVVALTAAIFFQQSKFLSPVTVKHRLVWDMKLSGTCDLCRGGDVG